MMALLFVHIGASNRQLKKWKKAQLDHEFLLYCKMSDIVPNFVKFKLYRSSLYNSDFYRSSTRALLDIEINDKLKATHKLSSSVASLCSAFYSSLSYIDKIYVKTLLKKNVNNRDRMAVTDM